MLLCIFTVEVYVDGLENYFRGLVRKEVSALFQSYHGNNFQFHLGFQKQDENIIVASEIDCILLSASTIVFFI